MAPAAAVDAHAHDPALGGQWLPQNEEEAKFGQVSLSQAFLNHLRGIDKNYAGGVWKSHPISFLPPHQHHHCLHHNHHNSQEEPPTTQHRWDAGVIRGQTEAGKQGNSPLPLTPQITRYGDAAPPNSCESDHGHEGLHSDSASIGRGGGEQSCRLAAAAQRQLSPNCQYYDLSEAEDEAQVQSQASRRAFCDQRVEPGQYEEGSATLWPGGAQPLQDPKHMLEMLVDSAVKCNRMHAELWMARLSAQGFTQAKLCAAGLEGEYKCALDALVDVCLRVAEHPLAEAWFQKRLNFGAVNEVSDSTYRAISGNSKTPRQVKKEALTRVSRLCEDGHLKPQDYCELSKESLRAGDVHEAEDWARILLKMGCYTDSNVFLGIVREWAAAHRFGKAADWLQAMMDDGLMPGADDCDEIMKACSLQGGSAGRELEGAKELLHCMLRANLNVSQSTCKDVLDALVRNGLLKFAAEVLQQVSVSTTWKTWDWDVSVVQLWENVIERLLEHKKWDAVEATLNSMEKHGPEPSQRCFEEFIQALGVEGEAELAEQWLAKMSQAGFVPHMTLLRPLLPIWQLKSGPGKIAYWRSRTVEGMAESEGSQPAEESESEPEHPSAKSRSSTSSISVHSLQQSTQVLCAPTRALDRNVSVLQRKCTALGQTNTVCDNKEGLQRATTPASRISALQPPRQTSASVSESWRPMRSSEMRTPPPTPPKSRPLCTRSVPADQHHPRSLPARTGSPSPDACRNNTRSMASQASASSAGSVHSLRSSKVPSQASSSSTGEKWRSRRQAHLVTREEETVRDVPPHLVALHDLLRNESSCTESVEAYRNCQYRGQKDLSVSRLISMNSRVRETEDLCCPLFHGLLHDGLTPDCGACNSVIKVLSNSWRNCDLGQEWLHAMMLAGIEPDQVTYNSIIHCAARSGRTEDCDAWLERMCQEGLQPCPKTLEPVIKASLKRGDLKRAEAYFDTFLALEGVHSTDHVERLVESCAWTDPNMAERWRRKVQGGHFEDVSACPVQRHRDQQQIVGDPSIRDLGGGPRSAQQRRHRRRQISLDNLVYPSTRNQTEWQQVRRRRRSRQGVH